MPRSHHAVFYPPVTSSSSRANIPRPTHRPLKDHGEVFRSRYLPGPTQRPEDEDTPPSGGQGISHLNTGAIIPATSSVERALLPGISVSAPDAFGRHGAEPPVARRAPRELDEYPGRCFRRSTDASADDLSRSPVARPSSAINQKVEQTKKICGRRSSRCPRRRGGTLRGTTRGLFASFGFEPMASRVYEPDELNHAALRRTFCF